MARIRSESEIDRTQVALARHGATLPLADGTVAITVEPRAGASPVGQRLLVLLVNELARMKGIATTITVAGVSGQPILPGVPLDGPDLQDGLETLVARLNKPESEFQAAIDFSRTSAATVTVNIGSGASDAHVRVSADGWRALLGGYVEHADWSAPAPYGAALAAALAASETFKHLLTANGYGDSRRVQAGDLALSTFDYGVGASAGKGPALHELIVGGLAVIGCGAGGTAALYVTAMQPGLAGEIDLVEPGRHKLSNLNRYLMSTASDVHEARHKLASAANHLARHAPALALGFHAVTWEMLSDRPWPFLLSTVDTVPARWAIQQRAPQGAEILDAAVSDLLYSVLRVVPGGRCLECKHPHDPDYELKQRAARWGVELQTIRDWTSEDEPVTAEMIAQLAETQNRDPADYAEVEGTAFSKVPALTECGETRLSTQVPSQAPVLPLATTAAGAILAAEIAKRFAAPQAQLHNSIDHHLARNPRAPRVVWRPASKRCPRHA